MSLTSTQFTNASLLGATFKNSQALYVSLVEANMTGAILQDAHFKLSNFAQALLVKTIAERLRLEQCVLINSDCQESNWINADIDSCNLANANLARSQWANSRLFLTNLHGVNEKDCAWPGATLKQVLRTDPQLQRAEKWVAYV
jgi:uncharacterized protein YjbI with pentapeptide repeats